MALARRFFNYSTRVQDSRRKHVKHPAGVPSMHRCLQLSVLTLSFGPYREMSLLAFAEEWAPLFYGIIALRRKPIKYLNILASAHVSHDSECALRVRSAGHVPAPMKYFELDCQTIVVRSGIFGQLGHVCLDEKNFSGCTSAARLEEQQILPRTTVCCKVS